jgi:hypothetical protein
MAGNRRVLGGPTRRVSIRWMRLQRGDEAIRVLEADVEAMDLSQVPAWNSTDFEVAGWASLSSTMPSREPLTYQYSPVVWTPQANGRSAIRRADLMSLSCLGPSPG